MFDYDRDEVKLLLWEHGFDVVDMHGPTTTIKGQKMNALVRRVFEKERLEDELRILRNIGVKTIGLYTVTPAYVFDEDEDEIKAEGSTIRWAYYRGV